MRDCKTRFVRIKSRPDPGFVLCVHYQLPRNLKNGTRSVPYPAWKSPNGDQIDHPDHGGLLNGETLRMIHLTVFRHRQNVRNGVANPVPLGDIILRAGRGMLPRSKRFKLGNLPQTQQKR